MGEKKSWNPFKKDEKTNTEDFVDLGLDDYEKEIGEDVTMYVKTAELASLHDVPELKKEIYGGNMLILDISLAKQDKILIEKAIKDLKMAAFDVGGDIVGIGEDQVIVTPVGIKIQRKKLNGA